MPERDNRMLPRPDWTAQGGVTSHTTRVSERWKPTVSRCVGKAPGSKAKEPTVLIYNRDPSVEAVEVPITALRKSRVHKGRARLNTSTVQVKDDNRAKPIMVTDTNLTNNIGADYS